MFAAAEGQYLVVVRPGVSPAAAAPVVATTAERTLPENKTTVLVADDDDDVMAVLVETLEPEGYRVLTASDGDAALQIARAERPDIVVLDWMMPGLDGLSVCRALRQDADPKLAAVPVVLITGRTDAQDTAAGFEAGVTDYLTKPFKADPPRRAPAVLAASAPPGAADRRSDRVRCAPATADAGAEASPGSVGHSRGGCRPSRGSPRGT